MKEIVCKCIHIMTISVRIHRGKTGHQIIGTHRPEVQEGDAYEA